MRKFRKPIKDEDRVVRDPERAEKKTFDRAVNLLTYKARSIEEMRARLLEKVWTNEEIVESVIEKLKKYNYLNDDEFARSFASAKLRQKAIGKRRLEQDLYRKKLDKETISRAVESAFEETPESEVIVRAIEKRLRSKGHPESQREQQNFFGYLVRLGFSYDLIRENMEKIRRER